MIRAYLSYLATENAVAASTQNVVWSSPVQRTRLPYVRPAFCVVPSSNYAGLRYPRAECVETPFTKDLFGPPLKVFALG